MSRESMEVAISRIFEKQEQLNRLLVFNLISLENDLLVERGRVQLMEKTFVEANIFENWPPRTDIDGELVDIETTDKLSEILTDLAFDRGPHTVQDLIDEVNQKDFAPDKKELFKSLLTQMGIPVQDLRAIKSED